MSRSPWRDYPSKMAAKVAQQNAIILAAFRRGFDTAELSRILRRPEPDIVKSIDRAREAERAHSQAKEPACRPSA
jgi:hypothetical protein